MQAEILTIGDEILIGQIVDTNSAWMGQKLNEAGINVKQITSVSDNEQHIINALNEAKQRADIILITGGLGPTKDDITKHTLCNYFNSGLIFNEDVYKQVEYLFKIRGREVTAINRKQAEVPSNCTAIANTVGTAPGMWFEEEEKIFMSMPGVPFEMKAMMEKEVIPRLIKKFKTPFIFHKTILTQGIGESFLADLIADWEDGLPAHIKLAYLPSPGMVRLRLTGRGESEKIKAEVIKQYQSVAPLIEKYVFGYDSETLESVIAQLLTSKKQTIACAESCTGGYLSHRITSVPGSSNYFMGSVIAYDNSIKEQFLDVDPELIRVRGAVSEPVVIAMAESVKRKFKTEYAIATSGIAGPAGGSTEKPIGTVWIGISTPEVTFAKCFRLGDNRMRIIQVAADTALNMLRKELSGKTIDV